MSRRWNILAWSILATVFLGMSVYLLLNPTRTGVVPNYRMAATNWWIGQPIYGGGTHGFLYFPQFIIFFTPFNLIRPEILGEILWRAFGFGLFGWSLWQLAGISNRQHTRMRAADPTRLWIVLLAVPAALASLSNGQTNLPLSACLVLAVLAVRGERWIWGAFWLWLAVVLKPIALAPWFLAFAAFPPIRKPLALGLVPFLAMGLANPDFHYALERWIRCLNKIFHSYTPENLRVSDLFGMLEKAGAPNLFPVNSLTRALACLLALVYVTGTRWRRGDVSAAWSLWVATALVFTVFNPRAETNSYVLISPLLAYSAIGSWRDGKGEKLSAGMLVLACICLMCDGMGLWIYKATDVWLKPLIVILVSPFLFRVPEAWKGEGGTKSV